MKYKNFFGVFFGTLLLSFGTTVFILPFELITGGLSAIALIIAEIVPKQILTPNKIITVLSWSLFLLGRLTLGKSFSHKTLLSTLVYPLGLFLFRPLAGYGLWDLQSVFGYESAMLPAAVLGGLFVGIGCAMTFGSGGSTGGVDILALFIARRAPGVRYEMVIFAIDVFVIVLGFFIHQNLRHSFLGILCTAITAFTIDRFFVFVEREPIT